MKSGGTINEVQLINWNRHEKMGGKGENYETFRID